MSHWPQGVILALNVISLVSNVANRKSVFDTLIAPAIGLGLLYAGGFFACWGIAP